MLKNLFLNTSSFLYAADGEKSAAELERESIQVDELKKGEEEKKDEEITEEEKEEEVDEIAKAEIEAETEEVEETAEAKAIREADEAANADTKSKRQVERMQKRIDTLTAKTRTTETENAELKKLLDAKKEDGTLTLTEEEVERRAELKAEEKVNARQFNKAVETLAKGANALDKDFNKNIKIVTDEIALLPPVMIAILEDLENEAGKNVGAEVLVYLSKNIDDYEDIYSLSEGRMALKLQNLANKITKKPAKPVSQVPAPNKPVGGNNVQSPLNDKMTDEEWIAKRNADVAAKEKGVIMHPSEEEAAEMPKYQSHKKVWALEINTADPLTCKLTFKDKGYAAIKTDAAMWSRYKPVEGDFYVEYEDGYKSFSPRKAFLEGYTKI